MDYMESKLPEYLNDVKFHPQVAFKKPIYAPFLEWIKNLVPHLRILWLVRNPRDVVASMMGTQLMYTQENLIPWPSHPMGGTKEVLNAIEALTPAFIQSMNAYLEKFIAIAKTHPTEWKITDRIFVGALCWRLKNELPNLYKIANIPFLSIRYENLVSYPRQEVSAILEYLNLPWHEDVLCHNLLHQGVLVGQTNASRPIDTASIGKWKQIFSERELDIVDEITGGLAKSFGYEYGETQSSYSSEE
jgi:hypothetical protein